MLEKVQKVLDEEINPKLEKHYGRAELVEVNNCVVKIKLLGQCSGCPSAKFTVENLIEATLKQKIPEIKKVLLENQVSDELLDMAKDILRRRKELSENRY